jgi:hypothetical protein
LTSERVERRLAAVLAADVAGYSRLMGRDEEGTLAQLKSSRKTVVDPCIAAHRGRIVKTTGDGMLVEFASAVDAARCAIEIQRGMAAQNADASQQTKIEFRIGIHVGDIIIDDDDIFGDGVNIVPGSGPPAAGRRQTVASVPDRGHAGMIVIANQRVGASAPSDDRLRRAIQNRQPRNQSLDCFVASAPRNDGCVSRMLRSLKQGRPSS